jgi:hypothetical protein
LTGLGPWLTFGLEPRTDTPQQRHCEDGESDRSDRAYGGSDVQSLRESFTCRADQRGTQLIRKAPRYFDGASERVSCGFGRLGRHTCRDVPGHCAAVDRNSDAAEDGDP